jgi:tRNA (mo5U34)-methyltransferase
MAVTGRESETVAGPGLSPDLTGPLEPCLERLAGALPAAPVGPLRRLTRERLDPRRHGDLPAWISALGALPRIAPARVRLDAPCITVTPADPLGEHERAGLRAELDALHPWRKGPFSLHGVTIEAEWRSDRKWGRLADAIAPLPGRLVLDLGCGNGYYAYRALGAGARLVLGIDPTLRFVAQFLALQHFIDDPRVAVLPLADDDLPDTLTGFDTVFSMGVLYHRRDAHAHLRRLRRLLRSGGELVLETLVLDRSGRDLLRPAGRYAKMRNVHAIPTPALLADWLADAGLRRIRCVDVTPTTTGEQRATAWMRFQSLADFLDPSDPTRTIEGHPAPVRAILLAER